MVKRKYGQSVFKRKRGKRSGWAVARAQISSIPRLTFKPMSIVRTSDYRCTFRVNLSSCYTEGGSVGQAFAGKDFNYYGTINVNSIFPWFKDGLSPANSLAPGMFDPHNGMYHKEVSTGPGANADGFVVNNTIFEGVTPKACPDEGLSYTEMKATGPDGSFINQPTCAPGLFETNESLGYQYGDITVLGSKLTLVWRPLAGQLNDLSEATVAKGEGVKGHDTEASQLYCFLHTQSAQSSVDALAGKDSTWVDGLANLPYIRGRDISGFTTSAVNPVLQSKLGNAAVLQYKYSPRAVHMCDPLDEPRFSTLTDQTNGFKNPIENDHLTFGVRRNLSGVTGVCAPSGYIELRLEQIIMLRKPMSTRTILNTDQPAAHGGGADPGGGGVFPQSMMHKGHAIGVGLGALHVASLLAQ